MHALERGARHKPNLQPLRKPTAKTLRNLRTEALDAHVSVQKHDNDGGDVAPGKPTRFLPSSPTKSKNEMGLHTMTPANRMSRSRRQAIRRAITERGAVAIRQLRTKMA